MWREAPQTSPSSTSETPRSNPPRPLKHQEVASHHKSILHLGPWGLGKRLQRAKPLLLTFTSINLEEKPSRAKKDIYNSPLSAATTETLWFQRSPGAQLMKCLLGKHLSIFYSAPGKKVLGGCCPSEATANTPKTGRLLFLSFPMAAKGPPSPEKAAGNTRRCASGAARREAGEENCNHPQSCVI